MASIDQLCTINNEMFTKDFINKYLEMGFGSLSKHDIDLFVYHLLEKYTDLTNEKSEYELSSMLMLPERRLKNIQIESYLKYGDMDPEKNLKIILQKINDGKIKPEFDGDRIRFLIESPILKRDFEFAITSLGNIVDYSFNKNILSLKMSSFFEALSIEDSAKSKKLKIKIIKHFQTEKKISNELKKEIENISWWKKQIENIGAAAKAEAASFVLKSVILYLCS